jgi:hypothetical protein
MRFRGKHGHTDLRVTVTGPVLPVGTLNSVGRALKIELTTGHAKAVFPSAGNSPAIVLNQYGLGRSALFAFDLVGTLMAHKSGADDALMQAGFGWLLPPLPAVSSPGEYVVVRTRVANLALPVDVRVTLNAPTGATVLSTAPAAVPDANKRPVWSFNLASGAAKELFAGVRLPAASGKYVTSATVQTIRNKVVTTYGTFDVAAAVEGAEVVGPRVIAALKALKVSSKERRDLDHAVSSIHVALSKLASNRYDSAIEELLDAANHLADITSVNATAYRAQIGHMLKEAQARWAKAQK